MLFFTILFLTFSLATLLSGGLFKEMKAELLEEDIKKVKQGTDNYKFDNYGLGVKALLLTVFIITYLITLLIYLTKAIHIDSLFYPSLLALAYSLTSVLIGIFFKKKKDLSTDEKIEKARKKARKGRSFKGFFLSLLWVIYFGYMAYTLVF